MIRKLVPFKRWHMGWLQEAGKAEGGSAYFDTDTLLLLEKQNSWTLVIDSLPMACGGTIEQWSGRHVAWTYLHKRSGPHMGTVTKAVLSALDGVKGRVELSVRCDFEQGHRWARLLGFDVETPNMVGYGPEGEDHTGYVRMNRD